MRSKKLRILTLAIMAVLAQGTCAYADNSTGKTYSKDDLNNLTPGFETQDINKSDYKVKSYTNSFSSSQTEDQNNSQDTSSSASGTASTTTTTTDSTAGANAGNVIAYTTPSTGNKGDFWGKTKDGKWILIEQGIPARGWRSIRGNWYYMDADGVMQTGWLNDGDKWYYLNSDGSMAYNTYVDGYYVDWSGTMQ